MFFFKFHPRFYLTVMIMVNLKKTGGSRFAIPNSWKSEPACPFRRQLAKFLRFQRIVPHGQVFSVPFQPSEPDEGGGKVVSPLDYFMRKHLMIPNLFHKFLLSVFIIRFTAARNPAAAAFF